MDFLRQKNGAKFPHSQRISLLRRAKLLLILELFYLYPFCPCNLGCPWQARTRHHYLMVNLRGNV